MLSYQSMGNQRRFNHYKRNNILILLDCVHECVPFEGKVSKLSLDHVLLAGESSAITMSKDLLEIPDLMKRFEKIMQRTHS
jgi:hypothetical protein